MRRQQHLQNVQYAHSKTFCIATRRIMGRSIIINYPNLLQQWILETIVALTRNPTTSRTRTLCQYFTVNHSEKAKSQSLELEKKFAFPSMIYPWGKVITYNLHGKFLKLLPLLLKNLQHIQSKTNKKKLYMGNSTRRN